MLHATAINYVILVDQHVKQHVLHVLHVRVYVELPFSSDQDLWGGFKLHG